MYTLGFIDQRPRQAWAAAAATTSLHGWPDSLSKHLWEELAWLAPKLYTDSRPDYHTPFLFPSATSVSGAPIKFYKPSLI